MPTRQHTIPWILALLACMGLLLWFLVIHPRSHRVKLPSENGHFTIFVLGGSTALGDPYAPRADVGRIAALLLGDSLQGRPLRVVNLGGMGKPAAGAVDDAKRLARHAPAPGTAVVFLYLGNNEFLGFDRRHDLRRQPRQLFDVAVVTPSERRQVLQRYEQSITAILTSLQTAGIPVIASTAAVNLRDWQPNRSVLRDPGHASLVEALLQASDSLQAMGELEEALLRQLEILETEPCFAWSCKRAGDLCTGLGDFERARELYQRAVDCDGNPYRETSEQNQILQRLCAAHGVPVVDAVNLVAAAAENGLPGDDLFWDNCHPRLEGYRIIAEGFARALCTRFGCTFPEARPTLEALRGRLSIDSTFQRQVLHERGQYCYGAATLVFAPEERLARARHYLEAAAAMGPKDAGITCSFAVLAALEGDREASLRHWRQAAELDAAVAQERAANRHVSQIMQRLGVTDVFPGSP